MATGYGKGGSSRRRKVMNAGSASSRRRMSAAKRKKNNEMGTKTVRSRSYSTQRSNKGSKKVYRRK